MSGEERRTREESSSSLLIRSNGGKKRWMLAHPGNLRGRHGTLEANDH
jgi:hypothetical protein